MQRNKTSRPKGFLGKKYTHRAFKHIKAIFQRNMSSYKYIHHYGPTNCGTINRQSTITFLH